MKDRYAATGRPSVDPQVFFRLQLVMFFEGIRSERELMKITADRLSVRWYLGYDLHEPLPDHFEAGLVWGKVLFFDSTAVEANAATDSVVPRLTVEEHLDDLFEDELAGANMAPSAETEIASCPSDAALPTATDEVQ